MKKENGYWIDENNNRWNCDYYTSLEVEKYSKSLINCSNCSDCRYCSDCSDCSDCSNCRYCRYCSNCSNCSDFKTNPMSFISNYIGSRKSQTKVYWNAKRIQIVCGCFNGNLEQFIEKVDKTYPNGEHRKEYVELIEKIIYLTE